MAAQNKTRRHSPQFGRASVRVTHFGRQIRFSENSFRFSGKQFPAKSRIAKQFASFSPEFLVLTRSHRYSRRIRREDVQVLSVANGAFQKPKARAGGLRQASGRLDRGTRSASHKPVLSARCRDAGRAESGEGCAAG
jgi:hypothetical protein